MPTQTEEKSVKVQDAEFKAMNAIVKALTALDTPARERVMRYLVARFAPEQAS